MLAPLGQRAGYAGCRPEVHVSDSHSYFNVLAEVRDGSIPLRGVRPDPVVNLVEVVLLGGLWGRCLGMLKSKCILRTDCPDYGSGSSLPEESSTVEPVRPKHWYASYV